MTKQLLIYEKAVPITVTRHKDWSVKTGDSFTFAAGLNAAPLMASEFTSAGAEYPLVFSGADDVMPAVVLGLRNAENLYVNADGSWGGRYLPAFLRQYPFVFSNSPNGETLTLCLDENFDGANQEGRGERLFDSEGERTTYLTNVVDFLQRYQRDFNVTRAFCKLLKELDLLEPMTAQLRAQDRSMALQGFQAVSREKLKALPEERVQQLFRMDGLELIYAHLQSLRNFQPMVDRLPQDAGTAPAETATESRTPVLTAETDPDAPLM